MKKAILILILMNFSCTNQNRLVENENKIKIFLTNKKDGNFNLVLDTISSFQWDELLVAGPYTNLDKISGYNLSKIPNTIKSHDSFILFCFINKKKGIKFMEFKRYLLSDKLFEKKCLMKFIQKLKVIFR